MNYKETLRWLADSWNGEFGKTCNVEYEHYGPLTGVEWRPINKYDNVLALLCNLRLTRAEVERRTGRKVVGWWTPTSLNEYWHNEQNDVRNGNYCTYAKEAWILGDKSETPKPIESHRIDQECPYPDNCKSTCEFFGICYPESKKLMDAAAMQANSQPCKHGKYKKDGSCVECWKEEWQAKHPLPEVGAWVRFMLGGEAKLVTSRGAIGCTIDGKWFAFGNLIRNGDETCDSLPNGQPSYVWRKIGGGK